MTKQDALNIIDRRNKALINPVEMLHWVWLRVIINAISDDEWEKYVALAAEILKEAKTPEQV